MTSPNEIEEALNLSFVRCMTCNNIIGHMRETYVSMIASGTKPFNAFKALGLSRYCCTMNLANPSKIAPGYLYNNPREKGSIIFANKNAAMLTGELSVSTSAESPLVTVRPEFVSGTEITISQPFRLAELLPPTETVEIQEIERGRHSSTATLSGLSIGKEREPRPTVQGRITSENFSPEMIQMFENKMSGKKTKIGTMESFLRARGVSSSGSLLTPNIPSTIIVPPVGSTPSVPILGSYEPLDPPTLGPAVSLSPFGPSTSGPFSSGQFAPSLYASGLSTQPPDVTDSNDLSNVFGSIETIDPASALPDISVPSVVPTHLAEQSIDIDSTTTQNLFLPTIIRLPDPDNPNQKIIVRQFSGV